MTAADLAALLEVQDLDLAIDRDRHRRATFSERAALAAIDARVDEAGRARSALVAPRDELATRQAAAEADLAATEARADAVSKRLYSGEVSASRELQAMADDVESLKKRASEIEDRALELLDAKEPLDQQIAALDKQVEALGNERVSVGAELAKAEADVDSDLSELSAKRDRAAAGVPTDLLATYDRLRARLGGIGAARLVGSHCDGCHLTLPATELDRIRHLPPGEPVTCDQCGRILVPT